MYVLTKKKKKRARGRRWQHWQRPTQQMKLSIIIKKNTKMNNDVTKFLFGKVFWSEPFLLFTFFLRQSKLKKKYEEKKHLVKGLRWWKRVTWFLEIDYRSSVILTPEAALPFLLHFLFFSLDFSRSNPLNIFKNGINCSDEGKDENYQEKFKWFVKLFCSPGWINKNKMADELFLCHYTTEEVVFFSNNMI